MNLISTKNHQIALLVASIILVSIVHLQPAFSNETTSNNTAIIERVDDNLTTQHTQVMELQPLVLKEKTLFDIDARPHDTKQLILGSQAISPHSAL
jgi:hypothetical protein